jgi:nitroreductase
MDWQLILLPRRPEMIIEDIDERSVRSALELAMRAPSMHNSQPWTYQYDDRAVHLFADLSRWLPVTDVVSRDLVVSCGAALHHLRVALAATGIAASVSRMPDRGALDYLASLTLFPRPAADADLRAASMIARRRTDRRRYGDWSVPVFFLEELQARASEEGVILRVLDEAGGRAFVVDAMRAAEQAQRDTAGYSTETAVWSARLTGDDGIPAANLLADAAATGDGLARSFVPGSVAQSSGHDGAVLLLLGTAADDQLSQLRAGEALSAVLLHATDLGLATCPLSQPLEVPSTYRAVRDELLGGRLAPQVLVRVGWGPQDPLPPTPRRPLDDVVRRIQT